MTHSSVVEVHPGTGGEDSREFARILERMYSLYGRAPATEAGKHRLVRRSPFDAQKRRATCFATVVVNGDAGDVAALPVRSYVLHPYELVTDSVLKKQTDQAFAVLFGGELDLLYGGEGWDPPPTPAPLVPFDPDSPEGQAAIEEGRRLAELHGWAESTTAELGSAPESSSPSRPGGVGSSGEDTGK